MTTTAITNSYDELTARLLDPNESIVATTVQSGEEAAKVGHDFLLQEYGSEEAIEAATIRRGRPKVGQKPGPSPAIRARITPQDFASLKEVATATGLTLSDVVREAVTLYLRSKTDAK